ncbi:MerR family DNA-binding transcriptional regulator [Nocardioides sp. InS609-2]|uniref:MerR family DNA-binding transcriptional regulator n=1 Tax=Nocardioides sp. InS609-2 TaxID=2760705 RepID=UPI0020BFDBE4|nr:MerR family DNA-binding transcriptional regulator [Nocardioides sp. InS609-2]
MLSIGDFARIGQVSVRMLRHYDQLGLVVPARVDASTGSRWYSPDQLHRCVLG